MPAFAAKARAHRFDQDSDGQLSLVALAHKALAKCSTSTHDHWLASVEATDDAVLSNTLDRVADLSDPVRRFTHALLTTNRRRLLDEH